MRILDRYLSRELVTSALFAVATLSLVLVLGQIFKELFKFVVNHNVPATFIITFIAYFLPLSLVYSIPWGLLTAVLLVFGRLSAGNELTAMRTAGLSIWRISRPILAWAVVFSGVCLWINLYVAPRAQQALKDAFLDVATSDPAAAFSGDQIISDFPGRKIYVGSMEGTKLENLHVFELSNDNKPMRVVFARTGTIETDLANHQLIMRLQGSRFEQRDTSAPNDLSKLRPGITMEDFSFPISLDELYAKKNKARKVESFTYEELRDDVAKKRAQLATDRIAFKAKPDDASLKHQVKGDLSSATAAATELNKRFSFSLACFTFALIGIPLGITAHRQETSAGFGLSLIVAFTYFLIIIVVNTVRDKANLHPDVLIWLPNVIFLALGGVLFHRLSRR